MITNGLGISKNPLNDISKVYLESVAKTPEVNEINEGIRDKDPEKGTKERKARLEKKRGMKVDDHPEYKKGVEAPKEKLKTDRDGYRIPQKDADAARERLLAKARAKRAKMSEGLDPVGQEDADIDNDGDTDKTDKYLHNRRKAIGKAIKKKKGIKEGHCDEEGVKCSDVEKKKDSKKSMKEGYHNWRQDLIEVMDDVEDQKEVKEKKVNNKIKINPELGEAVEEIGGTLLEVVEVDEMDVLIDSVYEELLDEGYSEDDIEEAIEFALTEELSEASDKYYDSAVKASKKAGAKIKRAEMMKKAKGRLRYLGRKAKEKVGSAKKKAKLASAQAQVAAYNKARETAQTAGDKARRAKKKVEDAPKKAKKGVKGLLRRAAQKVVDRMSEETQDLQELPIIPVVAGAAALGGAAMMMNKAKKAADTHSDKSIGKPTIQGAASGLRKRNQMLQQLRGEETEVEEQMVPYAYRSQGLPLPTVGKDIDGREMKMKGVAPFPIIDTEKEKRMRDWGLVKKQVKKTTQVAHFEPEGEIIPEEASDARKDRRLERRGHSNTASDKGIKKGPMTDAEKKKSRKAQQSAMDFVKAELRAKYGKGAVMDTKKK